MFKGRRFKENEWVYLTQHDRMFQIERVKYSTKLNNERQIIHINGFSSIDSESIFVLSINEYIDKLEKEKSYIESKIGHAISLRRNDENNSN